MRALLVFLCSCSPVVSTVTQLGSEALRYALDTQQRTKCRYPEKAEQFGPGIEETKQMFETKCAP